ncbi:hypothetical protein Taro_007629 [Colocasia esculenta]|uniref:peptide-methionine (S)-S-oxide reductase n=1 Tax=Colocasia esculenta TaxID=4460 RepID=A0A843U042_COLES|nr:hypothetical protein [Colocasia esculenta]
MQWVGRIGLGLGGRAGPAGVDGAAASAIAQGPDDDIPAPGQQFAQFGAGCFWGVELAFQRVPGVTRTEVGYTQGKTHNPTYQDVCSGMTNHAEVVRVQYDPTEGSYEKLLDVFWERHDPTTVDRQRAYERFNVRQLLHWSTLEWWPIWAGRGGGRRRHGSDDPFERPRSPFGEVMMLFVGKSLPKTWRPTPLRHLFSSYVRSVVSFRSQGSLGCDLV